MEVSQLYVYPIKSCGAIACQKATITPKGLGGDRQLMLVNPQGQFMTQRDYPQMAQVRVKLDSGTLTLQHENIDPLVLQPTLEGNLSTVQVWETQTLAIDQGDEAAQWFQTALQLDHPCRLVHQSPHHPRAVNPQYATSPQDTVSFADGYPILLTNSASLADLNRRLRDTYPQNPPQFPMNRFRPNIVIETNQPFVEDQWKSLSIGPVDLQLVKPCSRCIITTTDQATAERNPQGEPLKTLATFRKQPGGLMFGQNVIPTTLGQIQIGDPIQLSN